MAGSGSAWEDVARKLQKLDELLAEVGLSVENVVRKYPDADFYLRLLGLQGEWTAEDAIVLSERIKGTRHHRNHRPERVYAADLILGWVVQDALTELLRKAGFDCHPAGADVERSLLPGRKVTEEPDLWLKSGSEIWWLDIVADYPTRRGAPSYWQQTKRCDLRDSKFNRLVQKRDDGARVGLVGLSVGTKSYFGLEITEDLLDELQNPPQRNRRIYRVETHWPYGGKPAIVLNLRLLGVQFIPFREFPKGLPFVAG